jgi:sulfur carrier protein ThiS adenylyltransferase
LNEFEKKLAEMIGQENLSKIQKIKVGLAGAGGLGSNCAVFLVRSGFKNLRIVDFDRVETSNLNRQFFFADQVGRVKVYALSENLLRINPDLQIEALALKIEKNTAAAVFSDCDIVVEALDKAEGKKDLVEACLEAGQTVVAASGLAGWGRSDGITTHRVNKNFYLVGDMVSGVTPDNPPLAPGVAVAAAKQADVILKLVLGEGVEHGN